MPALIRIGCIVFTVFMTVLGGFASWAIAYEFWRRSVGPRTHSAHRTVAVPVAEVWARLTSPPCVRDLDWRGIMLAPGQTLGAQQPVPAGPGPRGARGSLYVLRIDPPTELAWGDRPDAWDHRLTLQAVDAGTRIMLSRVFHPHVPGWFDFAISGFRNPQRDAPAALIEDDIARIARLVIPPDSARFAHRTSTT